MKRSVICFLAAAVVVPASCRRNELCYDREVEIPINVVINWDLTNLNQDQRPENMHLLFFPADGGNLVLDFVGSEGGLIYLQQGDYAVLTVNNNTEHVYFRGENSYQTFEAYVPQLSKHRLDSSLAGQLIIDQPDSLYAAATDHFNVYPTTDTLKLEKSPVSYVRRIPFSFRSVKGMQYLSGLQISVDNLAQGVVLHSGELSQERGAVIPRYIIAGDSIRGSFTTFGHYKSPEIRHTFTITFLYDGRIITKTYDVTEMMNTRDSIAIRDEIVFQPIEGAGGFDSGVGDWTDEEITLSD